MPSGKAVMPSARRRPPRDGGYVMIVLMIAVAVLAVFLLMAVPLWQTEMQRQAEEELIFRARQYVTAIGLYVKNHNNVYPQNF
jgi:type II secretory pathway pseudopilin PulG